MWLSTFLQRTNFGNAVVHAEGNIEEDEEETCDMTYPQHNAWKFLFISSYL